MTKPTKAQERARELLVEGLLNVTEASRLNPGSPINPADWTIFAERIAKIATPFSLDQIFERALERRGQSLNFRAGTGELLLLVESEIPPLQLLLIDDDAFRQSVSRAETLLGET